MNRLEEMQYDPLMNNVSKKKSQKTISLLDYVEDPKREESLIGLQYVVDVKMSDTDKSVVKCNLCDVKGLMATMKEHLVGINHIKLYMEKHYFKLYQSLRKSNVNKSHFVKILKDYAKEIERAEGRRGVKIEYVSAAEMKREQENWVTEREERVESQVEQNQSQVLDKRQMALNYSENFKISSREEATIVLNLTQHLSDQLEQYFFKYKGLNILDSARPDCISTKSIPASTDFPSNIHENLHTEKSTAKQGMKRAAEKMQWHTEDTSSPVSTYSFSMPIQLENAKGLKRKPEVSEDASYKFHAPVYISSPSELQSRKKSNYMEHYDFPTMQSSSSNMNGMVSPQHSSAEVSSSHSSSISDTYRKSSVPNEKAFVSKTFGGEMQMVKDTSQNSISQNKSYGNISNVKAIQGTKSLNDADTDAVNNTAVPGPSCSTRNCSLEPASEKPSSSQPQGKTAKALSPDILQLLKGQDANTVTNILRTLSPFYPALQEVNLDMLAQVLVNTGVLD
ncbi:uncharacterized protein [Phyllobates terribilis]|uniref:uncharacterized protein isoform X2 n=1 Tax=Phyllobates terribilis TaxID=111132 RepID=UPI003CCB2BF0